MSHCQNAKDSPISSARSIKIFKKPLDDILKKRPAPNSKIKVMQEKAEWKDEDESEKSKKD